MKQIICITQFSTESEHNDAADKTLEVGDKINILRINQKRTLQEVVDNCGLSKSMISKIENNKTVPSVAALVKIVQTLGTNISNLFEQDGWAKRLLQPEKKRKKSLSQLKRDTRYFLTLPSFIRKR